MNCKLGGDHDPIQVGGHWYCAKCNKLIDEPVKDRWRKKK